VPSDSRDLVSCIIPVFDGARYVAEAIRSVLAQTEPPLEILVVDDGSTDDTARVVGAFGGAVTFLRQAHAGVSAARNLGVQRARGGLLCFLDADDRLHPEKLARQRAYLQAQPGLEFCDARTRYFWSEELSASELARDHRHAHAFWRTDVAGHISTWLTRRAVFDRIGLFDEQLHFSEDTDWRLRFQDGGGHIGTVPLVLSYRRLHPRNVTASDRQGQVHGLAVAFQRSRSRRIQPKRQV
jgi:glycosyltransferase involved in cell wall biosynthesis